MVGEAFPANLLGAAAFTDGMDQFDAIGVDDAEHRRSGQEDLRPVLIGLKETKEPRPLGEPGEQRPIVARQPAIEGTIPDTFERMQQSQGHHLTGPEVGLGVFGQVVHLLIDVVEQRGDKIGGHAALLSGVLYRTLLLSHFEMSTSEVGSSYTLWKARPVQKEHTMSDNLRRYRAIRDALTQGYPGQPTGTVARHLTTLAALISGIVGSKSTQLPKIAAHVPDGAQPESRVKRFARWLRNDHVTEEGYFVPFTEVLLRHLALQTLVLVRDGSVVGRGCVALMLHVVYKGRALPIAWLVRSGKKGHFPEEWHLTLLAQVQKRIPAGAQVVLLGDGEFDGTRLPHTVQEYHWSYVVRTGSNIIVVWDGERFRCDTVAACIKPGTLVT